jgi:hypothetical protein
MIADIYDPYLEYNKVDLSDPYLEVDIRFGLKSHYRARLLKNAQKINLNSTQVNERVPEKDIYKNQKNKKEVLKKDAEIRSKLE